MSDNTRATSQVAVTGRAVARAAAGAFGGKPSVRRYYDEREMHSVDILTSPDRPTPGFATYSTLSLHTAPNLLEGKDIRVEIAGVAPCSATEFPNMLASAAFFVIKDRWLCAPGVVFPALVKEYGPSSHLQHVMWAPPFPWEELGAVPVTDELTVHWLLAVPISEAERRFLIEHVRGGQPGGLRPLDDGPLPKRDR
jgi:hypothetical protein